MDIHEELVQEYETWLRSWASENTVKARVTLAHSRFREWGLDGFTVENLTGFFGAHPRWSKWTRSTYHAHLRDLCAWLTASGYLDEDPMPHIRKSRPPKGLPRPLAEQDVVRVLSVTQGEVRDWLLLALLAGLRAGEVARIRGEDVSTEGIYVSGKGDAEVTLPCHEDLWEMAQRYPRTGYWFPGNDDGHIRPQHVSLVVGKLFTSLGIKGSIHRCRHTYGTRLMRAPGVNIRTVQKLMRHANLGTTANYTAVDEFELRAAIDLLPSVSTPTVPAA